MKKLILSLTLVAAVATAYGQGNIAFSNGSFYRISTGAQDSLASTWVPATNALQSFSFGIWYGLGESTSLTFLTSQLGVNSTSSAGIIANPSDNKSALTAVPIPGSAVGQANVWLQIKGWTYGMTPAAAEQAVKDGVMGVYFGQTDIRNINPLTGSPSPGTAIWQLASGTSTRLFKAFTMFTVVPEPSIMALAGLGIASMLIFRRRK